jgi:hypothetical protein
VGRAGGKLTLTLHRADGSAVVERQLDAQGSCAELAGALALMIAVWHAQEHAELPGPAALAPPPPRAYALEARTHLLASFSGGEVAPGALLAVVLWRRRWGLALSATGTTLREQPLGRGTAAWTRGALALGPTRRLVAGPLALDLSLEALLGLTFGRGSGYASNQSPTGWTLGGGAGLLLSRAWGPFLLSLGSSGAVWRAQDLVVDGAGARRGLPRAELRASAGLGLRFDL